MGRVELDLLNLRAHRPATRRSSVRSAKAALRQGNTAQATVQQRDQARNAALELLARSVRMGHRRLALIRLTDALRHGVTIPAPLWQWCEQAAATLSPQDLDRLMPPLHDAACAGYRT